MKTTYRLTTSRLIDEAINAATMAERDPRPEPVRRAVFAASLARIAAALTEEPQTQTKERKP
jgi:hypothetical protein